MQLLVNIDVDDLARAEAFYRDAFGLREFVVRDPNGFDLRFAAAIA